VDADGDPYMLQTQQVVSTSVGDSRRPHRHHPLRHHRCQLGARRAADHRHQPVRPGDGTRDLAGLFHHTDAGSQYTFLAFTSRSPGEAVVPGDRPQCDSRGGTVVIGLGCGERGFDRRGDAAAAGGRPCRRPEPG
jgi:hypothetical protein